MQVGDFRERRGRRQLDDERYANHPCSLKVNGEWIHFSPKDEIEKFTLFRDSALQDLERFPLENLSAEENERLIARSTDLLACAEEEIAYWSPLVSWAAFTRNGIHVHGLEPPELPERFKRDHNWRASHITKDWRYPPGYQSSGMGETE